MFSISIRDLETIEIRSFLVTFVTPWLLEVTKDIDFCQQDMKDKYLKNVLKTCQGKYIIFEVFKIKHEKHAFKTCHPTTWSPLLVTISSIWTLDDS